MLREEMVAKDCTTLSTNRTVEPRNDRRQEAIHSGPLFLIMSKEQILSQLLSFEAQMMFEMKPNYDAPLLGFAFVKFHVELKIELPVIHFTRPIEDSN